MELAKGLKHHGFRKWYERELLSSHAHLVLTFCCAIGIFAAFEAYDRAAPSADRLVDVVAVIVCSVVGLWALRRYLFLLTHAEAAANQAECPQCRAYARFELVGEDVRRQELAVRCRGCGQGWTISE